MLDGFFKDNGYGNFYQGTVSNTSGEMYNPQTYKGLNPFNPSEPNNPTTINPGSFGGAYGGNQFDFLRKYGFGGSAMSSPQASSPLPPQSYQSPLNSLYNSSINRGDNTTYSGGNDSFNVNFWTDLAKRLGWVT